MFVANCPVCCPLALRSLQSIAVLQKTHIFEIDAQTVKEQIVQEIYTTVALIGLFAFILTVFRAFGDNSALTSSLTTVLLLLGGGSVNLPLSRETDKDREKKWEERVKKQAEKRTHASDVNVELQTLTAGKGYSDTETAP